jgi:endonuclease/exonuclease/phosphatase family metal-dependent hydrolase
MSIYNKSGIQIYSAYNKSGTSLINAYDVSGGVVFAQSGIPLKVMTYNVGGWYIGSGTNVPTDKYEAYLALQTGMIEGNDPDVLLIEEYLANFSSGHPAIDILQGLFPYVHVKTSGTYYGRAVCSKYPITDYEEHYFTNDASRYYDTCTITISGVTVTAVVTHLDTDNTKKYAQIAELIPFLETLPKFFCGGDFNAYITHGQASPTSTNYINNVKPFIDAGFNTANWGAYGFMDTYSDDDYTMGLDNIYTSSNITVTGAYVDETKMNDSIVDKIDHMPLIATLTIPT